MGDDEAAPELPPGPPRFAMDAGRVDLPALSCHPDQEQCRQGAHEHEAQNECWNLVRQPGSRRIRHLALGSRRRVAAELALSGRR